MEYLARIHANPSRIVQELRNEPINTTVDEDFKMVDSWNQRVVRGKKFDP